MGKQSKVNKKVFIQSLGIQTKDESSIESSGSRGGMPGPGGLNRQSTMNMRRLTENEIAECHKLMQDCGHFCRSQNIIPRTKFERLKNLAQDTAIDG
jgi:hypothetical protein